MMASFRMYMVCVVLCTVESVHSYSIRGTIQHHNGAVQELNVLNYIDGEKWINAWILTLDRLVDAKTLPTLTIANCQYIDTLNITNIALENVPVFLNTFAVDYIDITGNKIKSVPTNAFSGPGPTILDLSNNEIESLAERSVNMGASIVILRCNKLGNFSQSWFEGPSGVKILNLEGNRIEYIQDRAFNHMTDLYNLTLGNNHIMSIGSDAFHTEISYLYLQFNDIAQLTPEMFTHRDKPMLDLFLHHNQLSYLPEELLLKVKPQSISLFGNPWQCQCLRDIERWLRELDLMQWDLSARAGEPVCVVPVNFPNICVPAADKELQQTYARGLSPVPGCRDTTCQSSHF